MSPATPLHRRPVWWGVVWFGGTLGTGVRYLVGQSVPRVHAVPVAVGAVNLVGAFLLGLLLEALAAAGPDAGGRRLLRLLLGTGFLGGFTTYSALVVDTATLAEHGAVGRAVAYGLGTLLLGALATALGIIAGPRLGPGAAAAEPVDEDS